MSSLMQLFRALLSIFHAVYLSISIVPASTLDYVKEAAAHAETYDDWRSWQIELDAIDHIEDWTAEDADPNYDSRTLTTHKRELQACRRAGDNRTLCGHLRIQSSRNICRTLSPALYRKSQIRTKDLIHEYVLQVRKAIVHVTARDTSVNARSVVSSQDKRQLLYDMRQALGRSTLVLQGGAMISMCHLGVVKALHAQKLLPRIITGTATGALVAALVGACKDEQLLELLQGDSINLSAFARAQARRQSTSAGSWVVSHWWQTVRRRVERLQRTGHAFDIDVLSECARDNLGDLTFEEAYAKTGRILNITVAMSEVAGTPQLLNYITTPHVLLWSAVVASISTSKRMFAQTRLFCKDDTGGIIQYFAADSSEILARPQSSTHEEAPLERIGELFNVNQFIVSQTRPYIVPFIRLQHAADQYWFLGTAVRVLFNEMYHWMEMIDGVFGLPTFLQRILIDEVVPSSAAWSKLSITPDLGLRDLFGIFDAPTPRTLNEWSRRGEKAVWPAVCQLQIRCAIEFELEAAYERVKRRTTVPIIGANGTSS